MVNGGIVDYLVNMSYVLVGTEEGNKIGFVWEEIELGK
jgi:hypothetical protein